MFVIYKALEDDSPNAVHNGTTVSILREDRFPDEYVVGAYNAAGHWEEWVAHVMELKGFDGSI